MSDPDPDAMAAVDPTYGDYTCNICGDSAEDVIRCVGCEATFPALEVQPFGVIPGGFPHEPTCPWSPDRPATATGEREKCPVCHGEGLVECRDALQCLRPHYDGWHPCRDCDGFGERPIVVLTDDHEVCDQQLRAERAARAEEVGRLMVIVKRTAGMGPCSQEHHEVLVAAARAALGDR